MILIKTKTMYLIKNELSNIKLEGRVELLDRSIILNAFVYNNQNEPISTVSYIYAGGKYTKSINKTDRIYMHSIELLLEDTISFLLDKFNIPYS